MHLGWWAVETWTGPQGEPTFPETIEYLCGKAIGNDVGFSLMGITPASFAKNSTLQRLASITRQYEQLRHTNYFPPSIKARLRTPDEEFSLGQSADGRWRLRPARYDKHTIDAADPGSAAWMIANLFEPQPLKMRLEVLMSASAYDASGATAMADFSDANEFSDRSTAKGVTATLKPSATVVKAGAFSACLTAARSQAQPGAAAWAKFSKTFSPPLNVGGDRALGMWVYGDGQGEVLNFQLRCPAHVVAGLGEHYVPITFKGWRYVQLIESESDRLASCTWPYGGWPGGNIYDIYRERIDCKQIQQLNIWVNNLPPSGAATCYVSPVRAIPLVKAKLRNPRLTIAGSSILLPVELESGSYLEFNPADGCKIFGPDGNLLRAVKVEGAAPILPNGSSQLQFDCQPTEPGVSPRVRITLETVGQPLEQ